MQDDSLKLTSAYISRQALRHSAVVVKRRCGSGVKLCAVVKADGYGHQAPLVVTSVGDLADYFAVATVGEAEAIYPQAMDKPILVMGPLFEGIEPELIQLAQSKGYQCTICSDEGLAYALERLEDAGSQLNVHLKVDTGMGRLGCRIEEGISLIREIKGNPKLHLRGIYTHLATADEEDLSFAHEQVKIFRNFLTKTGLDQDHSIIKHVCNTAGALRIPEGHFDMVRLGIGLYGYPNYPASPEEKPDLKPALRLEAPLILVKRLPAGQSCGYGRTFTAPQDMVIGIVAVGYEDGYFRNLSNRVQMRYGDQFVPVLGRVSMDYTIIDLTGIPQAAEGDIITVIDNQPESPCNAAGLAELSGTIPYEILTAIGNRVKRVLRED
jgi:alanine racemase